MAGWISNFDNLTLVYGLLFGFLFAMLGTILFKYLPIISRRRFKNKYPEEIIIHVFKCPFYLILLIVFFLGVFSGSYLFPFLVFKNLEQIKMVSLSNIIFFLIMDLICINFIFIIISYQIYITDKRVTSFFPFKWQENFVNKNFKLEEIKNVKLDDLFGFKRIDIFNSNGEVFMIGNYVNVFDGYNKLTKLLKNKEKNNV